MIVQQQLTTSGEGGVWGWSVTEFVCTGDSFPFICVHNNPISDPLLERELPNYKDDLPYICSILFVLEEHNSSLVWFGGALPEKLANLLIRSVWWK
jgi:hypothetical protein